MSKRMAMLIGLVLAIAPGTAAGQDVGASFRISSRPAQPELVAHAAVGSPELDARIPAGWAVSVNRGAGGGPGSTARVLPSLEQAELVEAALTEVALSGSAGASASDGTVTLTFVPL